ncbi:MAG: DJ-1/PfpI family protein [Planctomycetota bacterium]|nr:MAG: DJ-1/PfpI family protein [Planctomycetota bacterium]
MTHPTCLVLLNPGAEEIETMAVADILVRAGVSVTIAATAGGAIRGSRELPLAADTTLPEVADDPFDCIYLPGGMGSADHACNDLAVQNIIAKQLAGSGILAIICASPKALLPKGLGKGRTVTCYPALRDLVEPEVGKWLDQPVVWDGNLVTSQGPGTAMELGFHLAARLCGVEVAQQVAKDMLLTWAPA